VVCYIHLYLLIAMRKVYDQGYPKTLIKYFLLTSCYSVLLIMGIGAVFAIAFATL
jgi:NADH:ubiquinone oxidoreductase subunit 2 (subunit N)